jgi:hypothetical protein
MDHPPVTNRAKLNGPIILILTCHSRATLESPNKVIGKRIDLNSSDFGEAVHRRNGQIRLMLDLIISVYCTT